MIHIIIIDGTNRSNMGGWQSEVRPLTSTVFRGALRNIYDLGCML